MLKSHVAFMEEHAVKLYKSKNIPEEYGEKWKDKEIAAAKKFDKKDISPKDLEDFNRLLARQLSNLMLKDY